MLKKFALVLALVCAPAAVLAQAFPGMTVCSPGTGSGACVGQQSPTLTGTTIITGTVTLPDGGSLTSTANTAGTNWVLPALAATGTAAPTAGAILGPNNGVANNFYIFSALRDDVFIGTTDNDGQWPNPTNSGGGNNGWFNTGVGMRADVNITTGYENACFGAQTCQWISTGHYNSALGDNSCGGIDSGSTSANGGIQDNVCMGFGAGFGLQNPGSGNNGSYNTVIGFNAATSMTTGWGNTGYGFKSCYDVTSGQNNICVGYYQATGVGITTGSNNIVIGTNLNGTYSQTASNQLDIANTIFCTSTSSGTTVATATCGVNNSSPQFAWDVGGSVNVSGNLVLPASTNTGTAAPTTGAILANNNSTANAFYFVPALKDSLFIGFNDGSGQWPNPTHSSGNQGYYNTAIGRYAEISVTTGFDNLCVGTSACRYLGTGDNNVALGDFSNGGNATGGGSNQAALGDEAIVGYGGFSMLSTSGGGSNGLYNAGLGYEVGTNATTAYESACLGFKACYDLTTGHGNIDIGDRPTTGVSITTGASNIIITDNGYAGISQTGSGQLDIGNAIFGTGLATGTTVSTGTISVGGRFTIGSSSAAAGQAGDLGLIEETDAGAAPGSGYAVLKVVPGTTSGTCKLIMYAGTSTTPTTIIDNVGSGC